MVESPSAPRTRNVDPVVAYNRAAKAGKARTTVDYHIRKLAESAGSLSAEQAEQLRALLPSSGAA